MRSSWSELPASRSRRWLPGIYDSTLGDWVERTCIDAGEAEGLSTDERVRLRDLENGNARLRVDYNAWNTREQTGLSQAERAEAAVLAEIRAVHDASGGT